MKGKNFCKECGQSNLYHLNTWLEELTSHIFPPLKLPPKIETVFDILLEKIFTITKLAEFRNDFTSSDIQLRSTCFIEEARKHALRFKVLHGPFGYTNHFQMQMGERVFRFESLPVAEFLSKYSLSIADDKERAKKRLQKGNFPVAQGKSFWFWQKKKALRYGENQLGFPLVVKPRSGSVSRHVTTNISNVGQLKQAVDKAIIYSPAFIVERFIANTFIYRATVIDFDFIACVQQVPANIIGNGVSTIRELIDKKNVDPGRGLPQQKEFTLYKIVENEVTKNLLENRGYNFSTIPKKGEVIYLQKDPFLKLGGDLIEVTSKVHPDNFQLFREVAKFFDMRVTGIDFLAQDISVSWKTQPCAILELNSLPCIEMHHFPSSGEPKNVAKALVNLFFKYYL